MTRKGSVSFSVYSGNNNNNHLAADFILYKKYNKIKNTYYGQILVSARYQWRRDTAEHICRHGATIPLLGDANISSTVVAEATTTDLTQKWNAQLCVARKVFFHPLYII